MKTNKIFDVVGKRKIFYTFSIAVIVLSIVLSFVLGMDVAIEFRGGTIITYSYTGDISDSEIASAAAEVTVTPVTCPWEKALLTMRRRYLFPSRPPQV